MKQIFYGACLTLCTTLLLTGCVDNGYDLSNIDTTSELKVVDLQLPVNLDAITLDDIITIDEDSKIKIRDVDGKPAYVVTEQGEFNSDKITINEFSAEAPVINPSRLIFGPPAASSSKRKANGPSVTFGLNSFEDRDINISAANIDESIVEISNIFMDRKPLTLSISLICEANMGTSVTMEVTNLKFKLFKGLQLASLPQGYSYDPSTGELNIAKLECPGNNALIELNVNGIDCKAAGIGIANHAIDYNTTLTVTDANLTITATGSELPSGLTSMSFGVYTTVSELTASAFSGKLKYMLKEDGSDGIHIDPIELTDIPDFLSQEGTDLRLANPQLYISITNPVYEQKLFFTSGFSLRSYHGDNFQTYNLDNNKRIEITTDQNEGPYNFLLSPKPADNIPAYSKNLEHVPFSSLSNVLSGNGIPQKIEVELLSPEMPTQTVTKFPLGVEYNGVKGTYDFFAPLALKTDDNTVIVYGDTEDGWGSEDLDKLTITRLVVNANLTSTMPIGAELTASPIDREGHVMPNVTIHPVQVQPHADNQPITIETTGEIRDLDGIRFQATVRPGSETALSPDMTLTLKDLKATVSGSYITDF